MTREALIKHWDVMQAFKDGAKLKVRFGDSFIDDSLPSFGLHEEYVIVEKKEPTKRLPTIEEVEQWFLENKVFRYRDGTLCRIWAIDTDSSPIGINGGYKTIKDFCRDFTHLDGTELYITEN